MLPEEFAEKFAVSRETIERLTIYERLLKEWGQGLSLVGRSTLDDVWLRHFADSAQLFALIDGNTPLLDMGTGAGFPGMVLAIMGIGDVHMSDNNQKKTEFLRVVAHETAASVSIHNCKVEAVRGVAFKTVTARGLAPLDKLLPLGAPLLHQEGQMLFLKGRRAEEEVATAKRHWRFHCDFIPSLTSEDSAIVRIRDLARSVAA